jgi:pimeloyl-ACP methyl ester carboxylesterase
MASIMVLASGHGIKRPSVGQKADRNMATFVLVHGGFHGGWCYSRLVKLLRAKGHDVLAPTLSGLGERAHLASNAINLATHIEDVVSTIVNEDLVDVILCGHSYAGMVISGVAGVLGARIKSLFYLDAAVPEDGQSLFDTLDADFRRYILDAASETGTMVVPPSSELFQVNSSDAAWVDRLCTPHPIGCFIQKLRFTGKEDLVQHRTFVLAKRFRSSNYPTFARLNGLAGWRTLSVDAGHDMMINDPEMLAELLLEEVDR